MSTSTGYTMITSESGKKGVTDEEVSVGSDGEVAKKATKINLEDLIELEQKYNADLNQDNQLGFNSGDLIASSEALSASLEFG